MAFVNLPTQFRSYAMEDTHPDHCPASSQQDAELPFVMAVAASNGCVDESSTPVKSREMFLIHLRGNAAIRQCR
jgi:hypothetical protein